MRGPVCLPRFSPFPRQTLPEPDWLHGRSYLAATAKSQGRWVNQRRREVGPQRGPVPFRSSLLLPGKRVLRLARRSVGSIGSSAS